MAEKLVGRSTAGASFDFRDDARAHEEVTYLCTGLGAAETVTISHNVDGTWVTLKAFDAGGATNTQVLFTGSGGTPANVGSFTAKGLNYRFESTTPAGVVSIVAVYGFRTNG